MSMRYKGAVLSATAPTTSSSSAVGIWTMRQQLQAVGGTGWPNALVPTTIGQAYGGGYYAGKIAVGGGGVATHYLIVAPKATGQSSGVWGAAGVVTGFTSVINGPANSAGEAALGAGYVAATFCEGLTIGGYSDWYLPALNELEVLYYFLKPTTGANDTSAGSNANAVSPEPISTNYTSGSPAQTSAGIGFRTGETEAFNTNYYWCSTESTLQYGLAKYTGDGSVAEGNKDASLPFRAVRRVPV